MRILFLTFHLPRPGEPGAGRPWEELQLMRELDHDVTVITASTNYLTEEIDHPVRWLWRSDVEDGVRIVRTWSPHSYRRSLRRRFGCYLAYSLIAPLAALTSRQIDLVFSATDPPFMTPGAYLTALTHRAQLVLDERDIYPETLLWLGMKIPPRVVGMWFVWNRWLRKRSGSVVTVSPGFIRILEQHGTEKAKTFLIPNYFPPQEESQSKARSGRGPMRVLYAGGLGQATDLDTVLDAAEILHRGGNDSIRFVLLGAGERQQEYHESCSARGLTNIEFWGVKPRSEMDSVYERVDVAVHSLDSQWRNSLSSKIFEYMAHGKPVVFAGVGDIADMLAQAKAGIVVAPRDAAGLADALIQLKASPASRRKMGECAAAYVRDRYSRSALLDTFSRALETA